MTDKILVSRELLQRIADSSVILAKYRKELSAALSAPVQQQEPVAAQIRFRRPEKGTPDWSIWQPAKVNINREVRSIDEQGWEVEYRLLYLHPAPADAALVEALESIAEAHWTVSAAALRSIAGEALAAARVK
jgi:hypothetical protein